MSHSYYIDKEELMIKLSKIDGLIFVGGTAEYLLGHKEKLRDIDVCIQDIESLREIGYIFQYENEMYGKRAHIPLKHALVDIFFREEDFETTVVNGNRCVTIKSMYEFKKDLIKKFPENNEKIKGDILRYEKILSC